MKSDDFNNYNYIGGLCRGDSCITINGCGEMMVESHKGIIEINDQTIKLLTKKNRITVMGKNLNIYYYNSEDIMISGSICSISFESRR